MRHLSLELEKLEQRIAPGVALLVAAGTGTGQTGTGSKTGSHGSKTGTGSQTNSHVSKTGTHSGSKGA